MSFSPILIVNEEPNSIFLEIFFKSLSRLKIKSPIILIASEKIVKLQMKKLKFKKKINILNFSSLDQYNLDNKSINLIDVKYNPTKAFEKVSKKSNSFIMKSFDIAFKILRKGQIKKFINGPISKKEFLSSKYLEITDYISKQFSKKKTCMLIYNKNLSVAYITTHLPIKIIKKKLNKKNN